MVVERGRRAGDSPALNANPDWANLLAFSADGRAVFRADAPYAVAIPTVTRLDVWQPVFSERRAVISDLIVGPDGGKIVAVGVPVVRVGKVSHVLVAELDLGWYDRLTDLSSSDSPSCTGAT